MDYYIIAAAFVSTLAHINITLISRVGRIIGSIGKYIVNELEHRCNILSHMHICGNSNVLELQSCPDALINNGILQQRKPFKHRTNVQMLMFQI